MANPMKLVKAVKKVTAGKQKAINKTAKLNTKIEKYTDGQFYVTPNRAGNKIVASGNRMKQVTITGSNKKINKNVREAFNKAGAKNKPLTNKPIVKLKKIEKKIPKVPTKKRGK